MKIILTGSIGHIGKPLTKELVQKEHAVTVISSNPERQKEIEALGAAAAIGNFNDVHFLTAAFAGADTAYCMISGGFDSPLGSLQYIENLANTYVQAIQQSGIKRVVNLSSIGAHTDQGNGVLALYYAMEKILNHLPSDVGMTFLRPVGFYDNLFAYLNTIREQSIIATNYGGDEKKPWVSPIDIAAAVAEELTIPLVGRKVRYVASDEVSCDEIARTLGAAIGKPDLKWIMIPDEQVLGGMIAAGRNPSLAAGFVEMNAAIRSGKLYDDYYCNHPVLGNVKLGDFAKEFAMVYNQK